MFWVNIWWINRSRLINSLTGIDWYATVAWNITCETQIHKAFKGFGVTFVPGHMKITTRFTDVDIITNGDSPSQKIFIITLILTPTIVMFQHLAQDLAANMFLARMTSYGMWHRLLRGLFGIWFWWDYTNWWLCWDYTIMPCIYLSWKWYISMIHYFGEVTSDPAYFWAWEVIHKPRAVSLNSAQRQRY